MMLWAFSGFDHRSGSAVRALSSSMRLRATFQSKMPPKKLQRIFDALND
jgi:hypothetical protein